MKLVIDIDKKDYESIKSISSIMKNSSTFQYIATELIKATQEGTPLPEGHGDLIDRDVAYEELSDIGYGDDLLRFVPTVIKADE